MNPIEAILYACSLVYEDGRTQVIGKLEGNWVVIAEENPRSHILKSKIFVQKEGLTTSKINTRD